MPIAQFEILPDSSRTWVYAADRDLDEASSGKLLREVDGYLETWKAHGAPLTSARRWSENRFLTIAVDQRQSGASGCSIDGLFRTLKALEPALGVQVVTSGLIHFRGGDGAIRSVTREDFTALAAADEVNGDTQVFDLSVTTLGEWRARFASRAADSWHKSLMASSV